MRLLRRLRELGGVISRTVHVVLRSEGIARPVFIIGCGRSGTTIVGTALSKHKRVTYLNEPRHLWLSAYPETDVWTPRARSRGGKLVLTAADVKRRRSAKLSRLFRFETIKSGKPVLIEKLPINSFRLGFIHQSFPDARFIHIYRSGFEVATSIGRLSEAGAWFGANAYKWEKLSELALRRSDTRSLPALCSTPFDKGLLEWRLSTEAAVAFLRHLPGDGFCELSYDELVRDPVNAISHVLKFIGIDDDAAVEEFVSRHVVRRTSAVGHRELSEKEAMLGGKLLPLSVDGERGLARRCA